MLVVELGVNGLEEAVRREMQEWVRALIVALVLALALRTFVIEPYRVEGASMETSLYDSERLFINRLVYRLRQPQRGEVAIVELPNEDITIIKRVIGLPGETIEIRDGSVYIEGQRLAEPYLTQATLGIYGPVEIPEDYYFVMGDNRGNSRDSRSLSIGFVHRSQIKGQAIFVFWPLPAMRLVR